MRALKVGDWVVCTGANEMFNERLSFTARYINRGRAPQDFVPEKRPGKPVPAHYAIVAPEKLTDYSQLNLFEQSALPEDLVKNTFVVFDLETTGLVNVPAGGKMDAITEIGAVKIIGGEIREKFTTLVNPERKLDDEIVRITGITDDMLKDAPKIAEVIPDFINSATAASWSGITCSSTTSSSSITAHRKNICSSRKRTTRSPSRRGCSFCLTIN